MKILVVGDTILDIYTYVSVDRVSPEGPFLIADYLTEDHVLGGACNVAANIRTLLKDKDVKIDYFGFYSLEIQNLLLKYKIDCIGIPVKENEILKKQRFVCDKHQLIRVDNRKLYDSNNVNWLRYKPPIFDDYDIIVVSDYDKGTLKEEEFKTLGETSSFKIIDLKRVRSNMRFLPKCILKCNSKEFISNLHILGIGPEIVVTNGGEGYFLPLTNEKFSRANIDGEVIDVVGAGDVFLAGMSVNFLETGCFDIYDMSAFGNKCAGEKVKHFGTVALDRGLI